MKVNMVSDKATQLFMLFQNLLKMLQMALTSEKTPLQCFLTCQRHLIPFTTIYCYKNSDFMVSYDWFTSYLLHRVQYVALEDYNSQRYFIKCGVPQGSILPGQSAVYEWDKIWLRCWEMHKHLQCWVLGSVSSVWGFLSLYGALWLAPHLPAIRPG